MIVKAEQKKSELSFGKEFLFINAIALFGSIIMFLFQWLINIIKNLVFVDIETTVLTVTLYAFTILFLSILEAFLLDPKYLVAKTAVFSASIKRHPQIQTVLELINSIICCCITFLIALPLGSEGPSVYIGTMIEQYFATWFYRRNIHLKNSQYGSPMGYSLAFLNPFAGFFFYLEKGKSKRTSREFFNQIYLLIVSFGWLLLWRYLSGNETFYLYGLYNPTIERFSSTKDIPLLLAIPFLAMPLATLFKKTVTALRTPLLIDKKFNIIFSTILAIVTVVILRFTRNNALMGFADEVIIEEGFFTLEEAFVFLFIRFIWTALSNDLFYLGGHVIPTLVVGAALGKVLASIFQEPLALTDSDQAFLVVLCSLTFFACVTGSTFTTLALSFSFGPVLILLPSLIYTVGLSMLIFKKHHVLSLPKMIEEEDNRRHRYKRNISLKYEL